MPIVDLVPAVCLIRDPTNCREEHLYFESHGSLRRCMIEAVLTMAKWAGEHPECRKIRFRCALVDGSEEQT